MRNRIENSLQVALVLVGLTGCSVAPTPPPSCPIDAPRVCVNPAAPGDPVPCGRVLLPRAG